MSNLRINELRDNLREIEAELDRIEKEKADDAEFWAATQYRGLDNELNWFYAVKGGLHSVLFNLAVV